MVGSTILDRCTTASQIREAIAKTIAYFHSPIANQFGRRSPGLQSAIERFQHRHNIKILDTYGDRCTGLELVEIDWVGVPYLVFVGSDDVWDWWRNIVERRPGQAAFKRNRKPIGRALADLLDRYPSGVRVAGHSLGGALAQMAAIKFGGVTDCYTYQTAAVGQHWIDFAAQRANLPTVEHWLHIADPVYSITRWRCGGGLIGGETYRRGENLSGWSRFSLDRRIAAHRSFLTLPSNEGSSASQSRVTVGFSKKHERED